MTDYFAANEVDAFDHVGTPSRILLNSNSWAYNSAYSRGAMKLYQDGKLRRDRGIPSITEGWLMFTFAMTNEGSDSSETLALYDLGAAQNIFRVISVSGDPQFQYWNGSGYTSIYSPNLTIQQFYRFHIEFKISSSDGRFVVYNGSNAAGSFVGDTDFGPGLTMERLQLAPRNQTDASGVRDSNFTEVYLSSRCTIGCHVETLELTSDQVNAFDSGGFADVDEVVDNDDTNFMASGTANQLALFGHPNMTPLPAGHEIRSVSLGVRVAKDVGGPQDLRAVMRSGGTDYNETAYGGLGASPIGEHSLWETDPDTGAAWTEAGVNAMFPGFESQA